MSASRILKHPATARVIDNVRRELAREGWPSNITLIGDQTVSPGPMSANYLLQTILHGKRFSLLAPDARVLLEDPKYMKPWELRDARLEDGQLVLDVWGA